MTSPIWIVWWLTLVAQVGWVTWLGKRWSEDAAKTGDDTAS